MANPNDVVKPIVPTVTVSEEMSAKLYRAFLGLPDARHEKVAEDAKARNISVQQATLEDILYDKIEHYATKAAEREAENLTKAMNILVGMGRVKNLDAAKELLEQLSKQ